MPEKRFVPGAEYCIRAYRADINKCYRFKLLSMGLVPGARFLVRRLAPLGDTMQIEINDFSLSLRSHELQDLEIEAVNV